MFAIMICVSAALLVALVLHVCCAVAIVVARQLQQGIVAPPRGRKKASPAPSFRSEAWQVLVGFFHAEYTVAAVLLGTAQVFTIRMMTWLREVWSGVYLTGLLTVARVGLAGRTLARRLYPVGRGDSSASPRTGGIDPYAEEMLRRHVAINERVVKAPA